MSQTYPQNNHKFLKLYNALNEKEKSEFIDFCNIKFIGRGRDYHNFIEEITKNKNSFSYGTKWNRLSELTRIIEDYFLLKNMRDNKEERNVRLLEIYSSRNMSNAVESQFNRTMKLMKSQKHTISTFYELHRTHTAYSAHLMQSNRYLEYVKHFRKQSEYVISHFLIYILGSQIEFNQQKLGNIWHDYLANETVLNNMDIDEIIGSFKENVPDVYLNVKFLYCQYKAFSEPENTEYFFEAKRIFNLILPSLSKGYAGIAYQALINYCINRTNNFDSSFYRVLFDLYNEKLSNGFDEDIRMKNYPTNNFRDYVIIALRLKKFDWVEKFIKEYGAILPEDYKNNETGIARAMLYMAENKYDPALKSLQKIRHKHYLHYTDTSEMRLRIYYEKNDILNAYDELARFERFLAENESIPKQTKLSYTKFRIAFKKLLRLRERFSEDRLAKIELYLQKHPNFFRRAWIEEKLEDFLD